MTTYIGLIVQQLWMTSSRVRTDPVLVSGPAGSSLDRSGPGFFGGPASVQNIKTELQYVKKTFCTTTAINFCKEIDLFWIYIKANEKAISVWQQKKKQNLPVMLEANGVISYDVTYMLTHICRLSIRNVVKLTATYFLLHNSLIVSCGPLWCFLGPLRQRLMSK